MQMFYSRLYEAVRVENMTSQTILKEKGQIKSEQKDVRCDILPRTCCSCVVYAYEGRIHDTEMTSRIEHAALLLLA